MYESTTKIKMSKIIAHRGGVGGTKIIENTLCAFKRAFKMQNVNGIECDLRRVMSGEIVIFHDSHLPEDTQTINMYTLDELFNKYDVCTLDELLNLAREHKYEGILNLEIKEYNIAGDLCDILKNYPQLNIMISSFLHPEVKVAQEHFENFFNIKFGLLYGCYPLSLFETLETTTYNVIISQSVLPLNSTDLMKKLSMYNERVYVYTVNDAALRQVLMSLKIGIITDYPLH